MADKIPFQLGPSEISEYRFNVFVSRLIVSIRYDMLRIGEKWQKSQIIILTVIDCMDPNSYLAKGTSITAFAKGLENATELQNLTIGLMERGYSEEEVRGILGLNFLRFLKAALNPKDSNSCDLLETSRM